MITAEIISIGDELTIGAILDTNQQWLAQRLTELGVRVLYHSTVSDEMKPIVSVFQIAVNRADVIICTGGLGPTADDLTRQAIAQLLNVPLVLDKSMLEGIRQIFFHRRYHEMPESNAIQACFPQGTKFIPNPNGTAPGIEAVVSQSGKKSWIFALPGVPAEMREMWFGTVVDHLRNMVGTPEVIKIRTIHSFGRGESAVEQLFPHLIHRDHYPRVGITASDATITLRIVAQETTEADCDAVIEPVAQLIYEKLGDAIFGENGETLADVACEKLQQEQKSLIVLEWNRSCPLQKMLCESKKYPTAGSIESRNDPTLLFSDTTIDFDAESQKQLVSFAAEKARIRFQKDFALAIGPFPPDSEFNAENPISVWVALATEQEVRTTSWPFAGHPALFEQIMAKRALNFLRLCELF